MSAQKVRIAVTGATGFVGQALVAQAGLQAGLSVQAWVRQLPLRTLAGVSYVVSGDLSEAHWKKDAWDSEVVVHCAARAHVVQDAAPDPLQAYREVNAQATLNLARQAAAAGVRRFVFISSIKVNGEATVPGQSFFADDAAAPLEPYGVSKMEAEQGLREIAKQTGMEVVIIRPPLVYGPGVKANFLSMMRWLFRGIPLPLGAIDNRRSLVALDNLVDLIVTCIDHPAAANQTFLVSDGQDMSTTELLRRMGRALGKPARLLPVPPALLKAGAALVGKPEHGAAFVWLIAGGHFQNPGAVGLDAADFGGRGFAPGGARVFA